MSSLFLLIKPFTLFTWLMVGCVLCIAVVALFFTKKVDIFIKGVYKKVSHRGSFTTVADTILRTFGFLVQQASKDQFNEAHSIRHLVNWLHVMFLLITTGYNSGLACIFTAPPYLPAIDTVSDLVDSGLNWGATHSSWIFSLKEDTEPEMKTLVKRFKALPGDRLHSLSLQKNFAFAVERLSSGHFAIGDYITTESMEPLRLMKEDIYFQHCTTVFPKGSPFTESYNQLIHRLISSGMLLFWEGEVARKFLDSSIQVAVRDSTLNIYLPGYTALVLGHVQGAFFVLAAGLGMALIAFLGELCLGYYRKRGATQNTTLRGVKKTRKLTLFSDKDSTDYAFFS